MNASPTSAATSTAALSPSTSSSATRPALGGACTALVTPFTSAGELDESAFRRLVHWQVLAGIDAAGGEVLAILHGDAHAGNLLRTTTGWPGSTSRKPAGARASLTCSSWPAASPSA